MTEKDLKASTTGEYEIYITLDSGVFFRRLIWFVNLELTNGCRRLGVDCTAGDRKGEMGDLMVAHQCWNFVVE